MSLPADQQSDLENLYETLIGHINSGEFDVAKSALRAYAEMGGTMESLLDGDVYAHAMHNFNNYLNDDGKPTNPHAI
jgi:hypothetical protein